MGKQKAPTPQEVYRAKKQREEQEKYALLPPGLINHGNTCFMNSVLQGLIATQLLSDLVQFKPLPPSLQLISPTPIDSRRSPQLTNGHGVAGQYEREWVKGMPLGDTFIAVLQRAWKIQRERRRESISPKEILTVLGQKYDQYLDFRQQDAHEFLRQLLDAMSMEELDTIKKRQPPPPSEKSKKARKSLGSSTAAVSSRRSQLQTSSTSPTEDKLVSFADMIFGGRLTSLLVCQKCKHVSFTFEDFNDLSLSIKPEDYTRERKRDRLKSFAKKLKNFPTAITAVEMQRSSSVPASPREGVVLAERQEFSLGADPRRRSLDYVAADEEGSSEEKTEGEKEKEKVEAAPEAEKEVVDVSAGNGEGEPTADEASDHKAKPTDHVEFVEQARVKLEKKEAQDDSWAKLGRRLSIKVGLKGANRRKSRSKERSKDIGGALSREQEAVKGKESHDSTSSRRPISSPQSMKPGSPPENRSFSPLLGPDSVPKVKAKDSNGDALNPIPPFPSSSASPSLASLPRFPIIQRASSPSVPTKRTRSPIPPKPSPEEAEFLRRILADINPSSSNPFTLFRPQGHHDIPTSAAQLWTKMDHLPGIEECLRMFTAVEVLDGENMVGCRRCWKIANGEYKPRPRTPGDCFQDSDSEENDDDEKADGPDRIEQVEELTEEKDGLRPRQAFSAPASPAVSSAVMSSASSFVTVDSHSHSHSHATHASSLPTTAASVAKSTPPSPLLLTDSPACSPAPQVATYGGFPIPVISTTAPESPVSPPGTAKPTAPPSPLSATRPNLVQPQLAPSLSKDSLHTPTVPHRPADTKAHDYSTDESADEVETDASAASSVYSDSSSIVVVSPLPSANNSQERLPLPPAVEPSLRAQLPAKAQRAKQVIMRPAYKRYLIATPPPVLVIHLKRFQQISKTNVISFSSHGFKKLDDYVAFPEELDLTPFLAPRKEDFGLGKKGKGLGKAKKDEERCMYRLYAVVVHIGNMLGGHYVAYTALPPSPIQADAGGLPDSPSEAAASEDPPPSSGGTQKLERQWAYISDTVVRLATREEMLQAKAYLCMYERI